MPCRQYISPTPGEFPLIASVPWNAKATDIPDKDDLAFAKSCGFNAGTFHAYPGRMDVIRAAAKAADFKLIISNPAIWETKDRMQTFVRAATGSENDPDVRKLNVAPDSDIITAWGFIDHPKARDFGTLLAAYQGLYYWDYSRSIYMNLIGEPTPAFISPCPDYQAYLDAVYMQFRPMLWGYNHYPFHVSPEGVETFSDQLFYEDLMIFSRRYRDDGIPFWNYVQCMHVKRASDGTTLYPEATESRLRFQVFNSLAFCVQGLVFWSFGPRPSGDGDIYVSALLDDRGGLTKAGEAAKKINREVRCLSDIFLDAVPGLYYTIGQRYIDPNNPNNPNDPNNPNNNNRLTPALSDYENLPFYVETTGKGAFVTTFRSREKRFPFRMRNYVMVVSQDPENPQTAVVNFKSKTGDGPEIKAYSILPAIDPAIDNENAGFFRGEVQTDAFMELELPESGYLLFEYEMV